MRFRHWKDLVDSPVHSREIQGRVPGDSGSGFFVEDSGGGGEPSAAADLGYGKNVAMQCGQDIYKAITNNFYRGAAAVFLVYAIDNR